MVSSERKLDKWFYGSAIEGSISVPHPGRMCKRLIQKEFQQQVPDLELVKARYMWKFPTELVGNPYIWNF